MPRQSTRIHLPHLRYKIDLLCAQGGWTLADLARQVHLSPNTVSEYIAGVAGHTSKAAETLPQDKLDRFAQVLRAHTRAELSEAEARDAWLSADRDAFASLFGVRRISNLAELLSGRPPLLQIQARIEPLHTRRALADADLDDRPVTGDLIKLNHLVSGVRFTILTEPRSRLFCACGTHEGWYQLVPGRRHAGLITASWEHVPGSVEPPIGFSPPTGRHRFVFIQARRDTLRARDVNLGLVQPLTDPEIAALGDQLRAGPDPGTWTWGEVVVDVE